MLEKITTFLRKNALTMILAFLPPILIWFFLQKESAALSVSATSETSVISVNSDYSSDIEVFYKKKPIAGLFVADIRVKNEGNRPIEKSDFDKPLTIDFNGEVISPVEIVSTIPDGLPVKVKTAGNSVEIEPLLINPGDIFSIQVKVIDPAQSKLGIKPTARIKAIKDIAFSPYSKEDNPWYPFVLGVIVSLLVGISLISGIILFKQFKLVSISLPGITLDLTREIEANHEISQRMEKMAEKLSISGHDFKGNILFLRLKIESLLRELAGAHELKVRNPGSVSFLSRELANNEVIDLKVVSLIRDIMPAMNRELHESESYLTEREFEVLQHAALSIIASLEENLEHGKNQR